MKSQCCGAIEKTFAQKKTGAEAPVPCIGPASAGRFLAARRLLGRGRRRLLAGFRFRLSGGLAAGRGRGRAVDELDVRHRRGVAGAEAAAQHARVAAWARLVARTEL